MKKEVESLRGLLDRDESIFKIVRDYAYPIYIIAPQNENREVQDIAGCIEDTLHRLLETGGDVCSILDAEHISYDDANYYDENGEPYDEIYEIDLGYAISNFRPIAVEWIEDYVAPTHMYTLSRHGDISIPDDLDDEEILGMVCKEANLVQEETFIRDIHGDGSMYLIQPYGSEDLMLKRVA